MPLCQLCFATPAPLLDHRNAKCSSVTHHSSLVHLVALSENRRTFLRSIAASTFGSLLANLLPNQNGLKNTAQAARPEGVDRPDLLPKGDLTPVIDLEGYIASKLENRLVRDIGDLEDRTGVRVRILTQRYPQTPGKAIVPYWDVDQNTIVMVADYFGGNNLLKINVGENVYGKLPQRFWSLLASKYGSKFYVEKNGEDQAIVQSFSTIRDCIYKGGCKAPP